MHEQEYFDPMNPGREDDRAAADSLSEEDQASESLLKSFGPASSEIDRDRLMFLAGRAAALAEAANPQPTRSLRTGKDRGWLWPAATAAMSAVSLALAIALVVRPAASIADREGPAPPHRQAPQVPEPPDGPALVEISKPAEGEGLASGGYQGAAPAEAVPTVGSRARNYLHEREIAVNHGVDALPISAAPAGSVARAALPQRKLLEELLPSAVGEESSSGPFGEFFSWPSLIQSEDNL